MSKGVKDKLSLDSGSTTFQALYNTLLQTSFFFSSGISCSQLPSQFCSPFPACISSKCFPQSSIPSLQNSSTCKPGNVLIKIKQDPLLNLSVNANWEKHTMPQLLKSCGFPRRMSIPQTTASRGMFCQDGLNDVRSCNLKRKKSNLWSSCLTD